MVLPKKYRLADKLEIEKVFKKGKIINSNLFFIRFSRNHLFFSRFVIMVSSKISKKAVTRNKIKRRLSEIIRSGILENGPGYDLIIATKPKVLNQKYDELKEALIKEVDKIK